ncbi:MAG: GDP-mannose 4,6-dehydratase, partial [Candidatus Acidiferrales bacterium]
QRLAGQALTIHGDGAQTRDFTHVHDVVRANLAAMECALADGRAINIGRGASLSVNQIAALIGGPVIKLPRRLGDPRATLADISQAKQLLGWKPQIDTEEGIREFGKLAGIQ